MKTLRHRRRMCRAAILIFLFSLQWLTAAPIPLDFDKNAVQFLFTKSGTNFVPLGTCFGVNIPTTHRPRKFMHIITLRSPLTQPCPYFVTAKHVLFDTHGQLRPDIYFRINNQDGGISYFRLNPDIADGKMRVITHTNNAVDLAAIAVARPALNLLTNKHSPKPGVALKLRFFEASIMADQKSVKKLHIREGDEMFFVGLFTPFYGAEENVPICRFGRLAMLPNEPIRWANDGPAKLYLMETEAFGGNSGSPAFFYFPPHGRGPSTIEVQGLHKTHLLLAGVVKGYFQDWSQVMMMNSTVAPYSAQHLGVTAIIPAFYLQEMLFTADEKKFRNECFKAVLPDGY